MPSVIYHNATSQDEPPSMEADREADEVRVVVPRGWSRDEALAYCFGMAIEDAKDRIAGAMAMPTGDAEPAPSGSRRRR